MPEEMLSVTAAAEELGMRADAVRRACQQERLRATKIGLRAWVIKRRDLDAYKLLPKHPGGRPRKPEGDSQP